MLNLKHHSESAVDFLTAVVKSKRNSKDDPNYTDRVTLLLLAIKNHFENYDDHFASNKLEELTAAEYEGTEKDDLLRLYSYKNVLIQKLKEGVTTTQLKRVISTCQNCTIGEVNSFDHMVPQSEFPEFVVHPKNLFPSCSRCNGHKSSLWRQNGNRLFLNLYLDKLPLEQYLFVDITIQNTDIDVTFSVENRNDIPMEIYSKIEYHYRTLHLCERFSENVDKVITPLTHSISANLQKLTMEEVVEVATQTAELNRRAFGFNYWKAILELKLLSDESFLEICERVR